MGGTHSVGRDNDELVDILVQEKYIENERVERAFRLVDRGDYISGFPNTQVYGPGQTLRKTDTTYAHLSAPCIYATVVETLDLQIGNSFLNVGSGTGYLSTVIGNFIGPNAINHGIDVRRRAVEHAYECLEKYITKGIMFDATSLAIPVFVYGNALNIDTGFQKYDRIYVGAEVPQSHKHTFCTLLAEHGKLVMPYLNKLMCVSNEDGSYISTDLLSVSFRPLLTKEMLASEDREEECEEEDTILQIGTRVWSLQEICRLEVYRMLGRERLAKVRELPISTVLQDFIAYYRDVTLPVTCERLTYEEPPPPPRSRIQAILQDPPPRIGEYLGLVERLLAERRNADILSDDDQDVIEEAMDEVMEEEEEDLEDENSDSISSNSDITEDEIEDEEQGEERGGDNERHHGDTQPPPCETQPPPCETQPPPCETQPPPCETQPPPVATQPPHVDTQPPTVREPGR